MSDPYDLARFIQAQDPVIDRVLDELRRGRKTSHWMWFVFPQLAGLGFSAMAQRYAIGSRAEAGAYLADTTLGSRLIACTQQVNECVGQTAHAIFGTPDDLKFHSSMTLFAATAPSEPVFSAALSIFFGGRPDAKTVTLLEQDQKSLG